MTRYEEAFFSLENLFHTWPISYPPNTLHRQKRPLEGGRPPELENEALCRKYIVYVSSGGRYTDYGQ